MIQLTDVICVLFIYIWATKIRLQLAADYFIRDPIKRRALYYGILTFESPAYHNQVVF